MRDLTALEPDVFPLRPVAAAMLDADDAKERATAVDVHAVGVWVYVPVIDDLPIADRQ
jgi:hypothetical protein